MDGIKLKPCPFCGGEMSPAVMCFQHPYDQSYLDWLKENKMLPPVMTGFNSGFAVHCYHCGAKTGGRATKQEAAEAWNNRAR